MIPRFGQNTSRRRVLSGNAISDEMLLWLESCAEDGTWNPKGSPMDPQGGFHESIVFIRFGSVWGARVEESKSLIRIDRRMNSEEMLLWLEFRAGDGTWDPKGPSRGLQTSPGFLKKCCCGSSLVQEFRPGIPLGPSRDPQGTSRESPGTSRNLPGTPRDP